MASYVGAIAGLGGYECIGVISAMQRERFAGSREKHLLISSSSMTSAFDYSLKDSTFFAVEDGHCHSISANFLVCFFEDLLLLLALCF